MNYFYEHCLTNILALMKFQKRYFEDNEENIDATVYQNLWINAETKKV
jgi:hypothetical protein